MPIDDLIFVDAAGLTIPDFPTLLERVKNDYRVIWGIDVNLDDDTQDGQWVTVQTQALFNVGIQAAAAVYNSFSPLTAQSDALTKNVKINGIERAVPTFSQVDLDIVGSAGTIINDGQATDNIGQKWDLPAVVAIPVSGTITVTAFADVEGSTPALANTVVNIATPTNGWQTVNNPLPAVEGEPIETDAELREQQAQSTMNATVSVLDGIVGAVASIPGVVKYRGYENDTALTNIEGIPAYNIAIVAEGGAAQAIGDQIAIQKTGGTPTFGSTSVITTDSEGETNEIFFTRPTPAIIGVQMTVEVLTGFLSTTEDDMKLALSEYISGLMIGDDIYVSKLYVPANLGNQEASGTFNILSLEANKDAGPFVTTIVPLDFDENPTTTVFDIDITLV